MVCMNVYCLLADAEATDASGLTGQFARVSLKPGAGTDAEEHSWSSMPLVAYQESQTDPLIPHMPCYIDAEVQCSPILVDKETVITDCSVVSLIAFISQVLFICRLFPNWWPLASVLAFSALTLLVGHACKKTERWGAGMFICLVWGADLEVGIRKRASQRAWRYPAYLWSLRWVYAVKKTPEVCIRRIPAYTPQYTTAYGPVDSTATHCLLLQ